MDHFSLKLLVFGIVYNEFMNINFRVLSKIQIFIIIQDLGHTSLCFHNLLFSCKEVCQVILQLLEEWFGFLHEERKFSNCSIKLLFLLIIVVSIVASSSLLYSLIELIWSHFWHLCETFLDIRALWPCEKLEFGRVNNEVILA